MDSLNMRTLAEKCKCSTQPIYLSFSGADEIKKEIISMGIAAFNKFIEQEIASGKYPEYKAIGMGYIRFAKEEKQMFKTLLMHEGVRELWGDDSFDKSIFVIMKNYGLYKEESYKLHTEMWLFVHGIATMYATEFLDWDWDTVSNMVTDVFRGLTNGGKGENK
ncbi:MAG: TetR/AcrR family transcriptional regulator [Clostridia bacterium]|nr:TetR/AcrR family transcriptional regulator [Clostridia bacterium]